MDVGTQRELLALLRVIARALVVMANRAIIESPTGNIPGDSKLHVAADDLDALDEERRREEVTRG